MSAGERETGTFFSAEEKSGRTEKEDKGRVEGKRETEKKKWNGKGGRKGGERKDEMNVIRCH